ncbi:hypothetical protein CYMTET_34617, partial [Cymbomonas tetramitiformis]
MGGATSLRRGEVLFFFICVTIFCYVWYNAGSFLYHGEEKALRLPSTASSRVWKGPALSFTPSFLDGHKGHIPPAPSPPPPYVRIDQDKWEKRSHKWLDTQIRRILREPDEFERSLQFATLAEERIMCENPFLQLSKERRNLHCKHMIGFAVNQIKRDVLRDSGNEKLLEIYPGLRPLLSTRPAVHHRPLSGHPLSAASRGKPPRVSAGTPEAHSHPEEGAEPSMVPQTTQ